MPSTAPKTPMQRTCILENGLARSSGMRVINWRTFRELEKEIPEGEAGLSGEWCSRLAKELCTSTHLLLS